MSTAQPAVRPLSPARALLLPTALILLFIPLVFTERVQSSGVLVATFWGVVALLAVLTALTLLRVARAGTRPEILTIIARPHYVQMIMHLCIFAYWGWYWPQVYDQTILILAQLVYVHALELCLRWMQGKPWVLGFGRFPIVFSTNLFLWFRDDWFYLQFAMITFGVLAKEFLTWMREGRRTHIFNPSAISLSVASLLILLTGTTDITWGAQISNTLNLPPQIYLEIFILGIIVQYLFHVTLVTLATVITLLVLGAAWFQLTGVFFFYTSDIPIAVFLGLHLLVTDPATTPRSNPAKAVFGVLYGISVMVLFELLDYFAAPTFYDKLLAVPLLNLCVIHLDRWSDRWWPTALRSMISAYRLNLAFICLWLWLFIAWNLSGHVGSMHPGRQSLYWEHACADDRRKACAILHALLNIECAEGSAKACGRLGTLIRRGVGVPRDDVRAYKYVRRSCDLGLKEACDHLHEYRP